jgi:hypothetical protein
MGRTTCNFVTAAVLATVVLGCAGQRRAPALPYQTLTELETAITGTGSALMAETAAGKVQGTEADVALIFLMSANRALDLAWFYYDRGDAPNTYRQIELVHEALRKVEEATPSADVVPDASPVTRQP